MEGVQISTEEFQRFQSQLLDLREAQICANDAKLRAESRVKEVEAELVKTQQALKDSNSSVLVSLKHENKLLREKLLNTESSFQLQTSTLRSEYNRLCNEFDIFKKSLFKQNNDHGLIENNNNLVNQQNKFVQTDGLMVSETDLTNSDNIFELKHSVKIANECYDEFFQSINMLKNRLDLLESDSLSKLSMYELKLKDSMDETDKLITKLDQSRCELETSHKIEKDLRNQVESIKRRSELLNRELRRELKRYLVKPDSHSLNEFANKHSLHSSSSSIASAMTETNTSTSTNSFGLSTVADCHSGDNEIPSGFILMADFKVFFSIFYFDINLFPVHMSVIILYFLFFFTLFMFEVLILHYYDIFLKNLYSDFILLKCF